MIKLFLLAALLYFGYRLVTKLLIPLWRFREGLRQKTEDLHREQRRNQKQRKKRWGDLNLDHAPEQSSYSRKWRDHGRVQDARYRDLDE